MAHKALFAALIIAAAASPASATSGDRSQMATAPSGSASTKYCMRLEALTGSRVEQVKCWTREDWASQGVDVDRDWAANGVRTVG